MKRNLLTKSNNELVFNHSIARKKSWKTENLKYSALYVKRMLTTGLSIAEIAIDALLYLTITANGSIIA